MVQKNAHLRRNATIKWKRSLFICG